MTIARELHAIYNESLTLFLASKGDISRIKSLRPSQLPFCPSNFFIQHATYGAIRVLDMKGAFYTAIGTSVHTVLQEYLSKSGKFLANWKCLQCGKKYKVTMQHECCDFPMQYDEIELSYKGIVGHIDAVFKDSKGKYYIVDFKTTSVAGALKKLKNPGVDYVDQIEAYALLLWLEHGIKVSGVALMFVKRNNPKDPVIWSRELIDLDFKTIKTRLIGYKRKHSEVLAITTMQEALALAAYGKCKNPWCKSCKSEVSVKKQIKTAYSTAVKNNRLPLKTLV